MNREILVHLNVEVFEDDKRTVDEIAERLLAAITAGLNLVSVGVGDVVVALAEEP